MAIHDFGPLTALFPGVIAQMPATFTAHEFILRLAQQHQQRYVEALYAYKDSPSPDAPTPFMIVHGQLAKRLGEFPLLVAYKGDVKSTDIFATPSTSSLWQKR